MILDSAFLAKLERLSLVARHVRAGKVAGERRSTKQGTSVEFTDYRNYVHGDDLRRVDWNIYARLERPFVKLFEEEEDLAVHLLLDGSGSMDWGEGDENKWAYARRLAAALGYIALRAGDRLTMTLLSARLRDNYGPVRGRGHMVPLMEWLESQEASGETDLGRSLLTYALSGGRAGLAILISDLFSQTDFLEGLTALAAYGHDVALLHLLSPDEVEPPLGGDLQLVDVETADQQEVTIDGGMRVLYHRRLSAWRADIRAACRVRDMRYVPIETDAPLEKVMLTDLQRSGVVK